MLNTVKHVFHQVGDGTGDLAHRISGASAEFAKVVGSNTKDIAKLIGEHSSEIAKVIGTNTALAARRLGNGSVDLARRVGPRRGLLGIALLAVAVGGGVMLARYLRSREDAEHEDESIQLSDQHASPVLPRRRRRGSRAQRKAANAVAH